MFFVDVRKDLVYASDWPSRPVRPILKVKQAPKPAYPSFRLYSCAIANHFWVMQIPTSKMSKFFVDVPQYLVYAASLQSRPIRLIF